VDFLIKYGEHNKKTPCRGVVDNWRRVLRPGYARIAETGNLAEAVRFELRDTHA
jgi:hypothetical protein